jgi:hypothetical protein
MVIENRQRHQARPDGTSFTVSEYRYAPASPLATGALSSGKVDQNAMILPGVMTTPDQA